MELKLCANDIFFFFLFLQALLGYASASDLFQYVPHQCIFSTRWAYQEMAGYGQNIWFSHIGLDQWANGFGILPLAMAIT